MTAKKDIIQEIYNRSNNGLEIIFRELPQAEVARENVKKMFKLDPEENASAHLIPPKGEKTYWSVYNFRDSDHQKSYSPIDIVMRERGVSFKVALMSLAQEWGGDMKVDKTINKPHIAQRLPLPEEKDGVNPPVLLEGYTQEGLAVWGPYATPESLEALRWHEVKSYTIVKDGKATVIERTADYPIFCQDYLETTDESSNIIAGKLYEPLNWDEKRRFKHFGQKPKKHIFGLSDVVSQYQKNGSKKLKLVILVSGGSDAVNCRGLGYPVITMGSETEDFGPAEYNKVMTYTEELYCIYDRDSTGIRVSQRLALQFMEMKVIYLSKEDMHFLLDKRNKPRKDLKDCLELSLGKDEMELLLRRGLKAKFWDYAETPEKSKKKNLVISQVRLSYFLGLLGYYTLKNDLTAKPQYIHIENHRVSRVTHNTILTDLLKYAEQEGWPEELRNMISRTRDMPTENKSTLEELPKLNLLKPTIDVQPIPFSNLWVTVTKDGIYRHSYSELGEKYVWGNRVVTHNYKDFPKMFDIKRGDDGKWQVTLCENWHNYKFMRVVVNSCRLHWRKKDEHGIELTPEEQYEEELCFVSRVANLGYHLHTFKIMSAAYASVYIDNKVGVDKDERHGRTGKTQIIRGLGKMLNFTFREGGKREEVESRFFYGGTTEANDLFFIDECGKDFDFTQLFGRITGDFLVEQKGEPTHSIPFENSPRLIIATNFVVRQDDQSTLARFWFQPFSDYYHERTENNDYLESRSIYDDIGCELTGFDYTEEDWQAQISFLLQCLQFHLSLPRNEWKIEPPMNQIRQRRLQAAINKGINEWATDYLAPESGNLNRLISSSEVYSNYKSETGSQITHNAFTRQLKDYCKFAGLTYNPTNITGKEKDGEPYRARINGKTESVVYIKSATDIDKSNETTCEEQTLPF